MASRPKILLFEFYGNYVTSITNENSRETVSEISIVNDLNDNADEIALEIQTEIKRLLPPSVNVHAQITFNPGSITWLGFISIMDWMDKIGGVIGFLEVTSRLIKFVVEKVMRRRLTRYNNRRDGGSVDVEVTFQQLEDSAQQTLAASSLAETIPVGAFNVNLSLLIAFINTILLIIMLILQLTR